MRNYLIILFIVFTNIALKSQNKKNQSELKSVLNLFLDANQEDFSYKLVSDLRTANGISVFSSVEYAANWGEHNQCRIRENDRDVYDETKHLHLDKEGKTLSIVDRPLELKNNSLFFNKDMVKALLDEFQSGNIEYNLEKLGGDTVKVLYTYNQPERYSGLASSECIFIQSPFEILELRQEYSDNYATIYGYKSFERKYQKVPLKKKECSISNYVSITGTEVKLKDLYRGYTFY